MCIIVNRGHMMDRSRMERQIGDAMRYASTTRAILSERGSLQALPAQSAQLFPGHSFFLVADEHTWDAAGRTVAAVLQSASVPVCARHVFPGEPMLEADHIHALALARMFSEHEDAIPIAIGSGTINDLVKLAAHLSNRPYICVATACSVDGYASDGAALLTEGTKMTHHCPAPALIIGDPVVLDKAPPILNASGYADLMAKIPAGADWILADHLGEAPIDPVAWSMVQTNLRDWLSDPQDSGAIFTGLTLCGIAMQYMRDSRPVSGAEHLLSHIWEMEHLRNQGTAVLHGIKVGIGSLIVTAVYERLFRLGIEGGEPLLPTSEQLGRKLSLAPRLFGTSMDLSAIGNTISVKYGREGREVQRRGLLLSDWHVLKKKLQQQLLGFRQMASSLSAAGCPVTPQGIGLDTPHALATLRKAQLIRNRYTILDALEDLGLMDATIRDLDCFS